MLALCVHVRRGMPIYAPALLQPGHGQAAYEDMLQALQRFATNRKAHVMKPHTSSLHMSLLLSILGFWSMELCCCTMFSILNEAKQLRAQSEHCVIAPSSPFSIQPLHR